jgi:hypothetical protein
MKMKKGKQSTGYLSGVASGSAGDKGGKGSASVSRRGKQYQPAASGVDSKAAPFSKGKAPSMADGGRKMRSKDVTVAGKRPGAGHGY